MKVAIFGYGNLGRGVECAIRQNSDMELFGIFSRRDPASIHTLTGAKVYAADSILQYKGRFDVLIICGGSATDLPEMTPALAENFNVIDSFDTHASIPEHFARVEEAARRGGHIAVISVGWDPGLFSLNRLYAEAILPRGSTYTFWGKGVSQGHSNAIRRIAGVQDARQYTCPVPEAMEKVRSGAMPELTTREKHTRLCYVVAEPGADTGRIEQEIKTMPKYFDEYDTTVHFVSQETLDREHSGIPHGGSVIRTGKTGLQEENNAVVEYSLKLDSNPEFTSSVLVAYARAAMKHFLRGETGCRTVFDFAPADLSPRTPEQMRQMLL